MDQCKKTRFLKKSISIVQEAEYPIFQTSETGKIGNLYFHDLY
jgi:hypothetical protein